MSAILSAFRGYRASFEDDKLISSLKRLRETKQARDKSSPAVEEVEFSNLLRGIQALIDNKKKKEALMALVAARLRLNDLNASNKLRDRLEREFVRLRAEIDAL